MRFKKTFALFLVCFLSFGSFLYANSQFRIDPVSQTSKFILQGRPSETVGISAFMQEGLDYLKSQKVVFTVRQNVTWRDFLISNGIRYRPGIDRYALRSDRYYRFSHVSISAVKPHRPNHPFNFRKYRKSAVWGGLAILVVFTAVYLRSSKVFSSKKKTSKKSKRKSKKKLKSKNTSKSISVNKKTTRNIKKKKTIKKTVKKKLNKKSKLKAKTKNVAKKTPVKKRSRAKIKNKAKTIQTSSRSEINNFPPRKSKSILIKPTAKRIKNIKLARQLALKSTENMNKTESTKKDLTLNDFIQEDLANSPLDILNQPTKTELRTNSSDDL
jgi:hypothetical protein